MFIPNGFNPGVIGRANVLITTNKGSFNVHLPLCQDASQFVCWDNPDYWVEVPAFDGQSVTGGTNPVITGLSATGILQNISEKDANLMVKLVASDDSGWGSSTRSLSSIGHITLSATKVCSMEINTAPEFGNIAAGQAATSVQITSNTSGSGDITFKPNTYDNAGGLINNDNGGTLRYSVVDSSSTTNWNAADGQWRGDLTKDYTLQLGAVPSSVEAGIYSGTMTASLSCE